MEKFTKSFFNNKKILIAPFSTKLGASLIKTDTHAAKFNPDLHFKIINSVYKKFRQDIMFPLMDVSLEANAIKRFLKSKDTDLSEFIRNQNFINHIFLSDFEIQNYLKTIAKMKKNFPGKVIPAAFVTAPFTIASIINGLYKTKQDVSTKNIKFKKLIKFCEKITNALTIKLIDSGTDFLCVLDPMASFLNPQNIEEFSFDYLKKTRNICLEKNKISALHICGNINEIICKIPSTKFDVFSFDSEEAGVEIQKIFREIPQSMILMGNINPTGKLLSGTKNEVEAEIANLLSKIENGNHFILSSGCEIPQNVPIENMDAFFNPVKV